MLLVVLVVLALDQHTGELIAGPDFTSRGVVAGLMALCDKYGIPRETIDRAVEYVRKCQNTDGGFRYMKQPGGSAWPRTAAGVASLQGEPCFEEVDRTGRESMGDSTVGDEHIELDTLARGELGALVEGLVVIVHLYPIGTKLGNLLSDISAGTHIWHDVVHGTTVVALGLLDWAGSAAGLPFSSTVRFQHVWVFSEGAWRLVASQLTNQQARGPGPPPGR